MVIEVSYPVYGIVTDGGVPQSTATVYIKDSGTAVILNSLTDAAGKYSIDLYDYATDGNTISVWAFKGGKFIAGAPFTLDISDQAKRMDLALATTTLADTLTITDAKTFQFNKLCADTITLTDALTKAFSKLLADTITLTDGLTFLYSKTLSDTITITDGLTTGYQLVLSDSIAITDSLTKQFNKALSDTVTITDALTKQFNKILSDTVTITDQETQQFQKALSDTITITDDLVQQFNKLLSDTITLTDLLTTILAHAVAPTMLKMYSRNEQTLIGYPKSEQKQFIIKEDD